MTEQKKIQAAAPDGAGAERRGGDAAAETARKICDKAISLGFDDCGIISLDEMDGYAELFSERMLRVPESKAFYERLQYITNVKKRFPWAKSLLICATWLGKYKYPKILRRRYAKAYFLSPQSVEGGDGYKTELKRWLSDQGIRCDGGDEEGHLSVGGLRYAAMAAGLGIIRKNNFFYNEKGSYVELDGYALDAECSLHRRKNVSPCPDGCQICVKSCPTGALRAPYELAPMRCVSFCTTFGKGAVPPGADEKQLGEWIVGCDACQDCCPHNRHDWDEGEDFPGLDELLPLLSPENILKATDEELRERIIPKTVRHIFPDEIQTLRINAERALRNTADREQN